MLCEWYVVNANHIGLQMAAYGYARVSTEGQTLAAQEADLHEAGATKVFKEKISGAANHRAQLDRLLETIDAGDVVIVTRLDRLARSTRDLLNILDKIAKAGATFRSLGDTWADTTTAHGRLMLTVLGGLAEFERELIRVRTGEGRVRAKARGGKTVQAEPTSATRSDCATRGGGSPNGYRQDVWSPSHYHRPIAGLTRNSRPESVSVFCGHS